MIPVRIPNPFVEVEWMDEMPRDLGVAFGPRCHPFGAQPPSASSCQHGIANAGDVL